MKKIKNPSVAGTFYPATKEELISLLDNFKSKNTQDYIVTSRAIIAPHAGYVYSGQLASNCFQYLNKNIDTVFIIAPSHKVQTNGVVIPSHDKWVTPIDEIEINKEICEELINEFDVKYMDEAFDEEHSAEVQIPFIQYYTEAFNIVPILVNSNSKDTLVKIIEKYWQDKHCAFVISSDLSHYLPLKDAEVVDNLTANMIEGNEIKNFNPQQACGFSGICALTEFTKKNDYSLIRVGLTNSSLQNNDIQKVVGYGAWFLHEGSKAQFIKNNFPDLILALCKRSIYLGLEDNNKNILVDVNDIPPVLREQGSSFVTLEIDNKLRGCIGSIIAHQPLFVDLMQNANKSAFKDSRFAPLTKEEYEKTTISVSLLSAPQKIAFTDEANLLSQLKPNIDGLIIKDGNNQAVYLPSVWEQIPDRIDFLNSLKIKAGLAPNHFSNTFEAYSFTTYYITNK